MANGVPMARSKKLKWAQRLQILFVIAWSFLMYVIASPELEASFPIYASITLSLGLLLFLFRCDQCKASYYYHPEFAFVVLWQKWAPFWLWPVSRKCKSCGLDRLEDGEI